MKKTFTGLFAILLFINAFTQNTLDNMGLSSSSPAQVAYSLRKLSSAYTGPAIKVRQSSDNAEANVAFDGSSLSESSIVTLTPGVTLSTSTGTSGTGTISTTDPKTGTISITVNRAGTLTATIGTTLVSGSGTSFGTDIKVGDLLFRSSDNAFIGIVKSISSTTALILQNSTPIGLSAAAFRTKDAVVTGTGTSFMTEFLVGDRIYNSSGNGYLGTVSSITNNTLMTLNARDAVVASGVGFVGTSTIVTGSGTSFDTQLSVGKMLIGSNNVTLGIISSIESATSLTLSTKAGSALTAQSFKFTDGSMSFLTFYGSGDVFVNTWYDQSGYGHDAIQYIPNNQPRIVASGVIKKINEKATIEFNGTLSNRFLQTLAPASYLNNTLYTQNIVSAEVAPITTYQFVLSTSGGTGPVNTVMHYGYRSPSQYTVAQYSNDVNLEVYATNSLELHTAIKNTSSSSRFYHNGTYMGQIAFGSSTLMSDLGLLNIGNYTGTNGNYYYKGSVSELTVYAIAMGSDVTAMNSNQSIYYGVNTANWTGNVDTDWTNTDNWASAIVPTSTSPSMVVIPNGRPNYPVISSDQTVAALNIMTESAATLTVEGTLQVFGTLLNTAPNRINATNGTIEYKSTSAQSILTNTFTGNTVKNLIVNNANAAVVTSAGSLTISNNLAFPSGSTGKLAISTTLTLGGTVTNNASASGLRGGSNSNLVVTGSPELRFDNTSAGNFDLLRTLVISGGGTATLASNLYINNNSTGLTFTNGKLAIGNYTLNLIGNVVNTVNGGIRGSAGSNLIVTGSTNRSLSFDQTTPGTTNLLNNFTVNTTSTNTVTANSDFSVNGTLTIASGQTLNMVTNALGGTMSTVASSGTILTQNTSSTPLPSGKTWGGTVSYNSASSAQTAMAGSYNNLTIATTAGATASGDISVNGVLSLAANPSATKGNLEMVTNYNNYPRTTAANTYVPISSHILTMGANATTTGAGDVTGKIYRSSIVANTAYTFGNQLTTFAYTIAPTTVTVTVTIGTAYGDGSTWGNASAVKRSYEMVPTGGDGARVAMNLHYLDSELNGNTEDKLVTGDFDVEPAGAPLGDEHGRSSYDYTNNFIGLNGVPISYFVYADPDHLWYTIFNFHDYSEGHTTWDGSESNSWMNDLNWSHGIPGVAMTAIIPDAATTLNDPILAAGQTIGGMQILSGGILNLNGQSITLNPTVFGNGWEDQSGLSNYTGSTLVIANTSWRTPINGIPHFDNLTINTDAGVTVGSNSHIYISGILTQNGGFDASSFANTVDFNKAGDQTIPLPDNSKYSSLTLSGSGSKNLPSLSSIDGNLTLEGTVVASTSTAQSIKGNLVFGSGTTFTSGSLLHSIGGNFENNGATFNSAGSTFTFDGTSAQTIGGTTTPAVFNDLVIANPAGVSLLNNTTTAALTISSGAISVLPTQNLTASGTTTLNSAECLDLKSDASGTASFIDNGTISGSGTALIERYLTKYDVVSDLKFHFISSPVGNAQLIENEFVDFTSSDITDFYKWNESGNIWANYRGATYDIRNEDFGDDFKFVPGKGYLVAYPADVVKSFVGAPYTGDLTVDCTNGSGGWNLVGNPYPSSINWNSLAKSSVDATLYYYDNSVPGYKYYNTTSGGIGGATENIAPMQGFMVHATSAGSLLISNAARTHSGQDVFYKSESLTTNILDLKVEGNNKTDYARVCFYDQATESFDGDFDAYKLFSYSDGIPELYTLAMGDVPLAINTEPLSKLKGSVAMGFKPGAQGIYTLTADNIGSFDSEAVINLEDMATGTTEELTKNPVYSFTAGPDDNPSRFMLHFFAPVGIDEPESSDLLICSNGQEIRIMTLDASTHTFTLVNLQGQVVYSRQLSGSSSYAISLNLPAGIYVARVMNDSISKTQKLIIK